MTQATVHKDIHVSPPDTFTLAPTPKQAYPAIMALFTAETAAEMARRSWEARRKADQEPAPEPQQAEPKLQQDYVTDRLVRVRKQIEMLSDQLDEEEDPNKIDRLANAITRLSGLEREYANRPLPGTLKPSQPRQNTRRELPPPTVAQAQPSSPQANQDAGQASSSNP